MRTSLRLSLAAALSFVSLTTACRSAPARDLTFFPAPVPAGQPPRPFSSAVRVGDLLMLSGQIGTDASGQLVKGGIEAETRQTLENIRSTLARVGGSMDEVVKCTAMLADMAEWDRMNAVYVTFFKPDRLPTRSAFGTSGLARGARVELECWAAAR